MENTTRRVRVWNKAAYFAAVTELKKYCSAKRLVHRQQPHQILCPVVPISDSMGGFLPGLELGTGDVIVPSKPFCPKMDLKGYELLVGVDRSPKIGQAHAKNRVGGGCRAT